MAAAKGNDGKVSPRDEGLRQLIRDAAHVRSEDVPWPSPDTIYAYLTQTATNAQRAEVQEALGRSAEFRRQLVDLGKAMEEIAGEDAVQAFEAQEVEPLPRYVASRLKGDFGGAGGRQEGFISRWLNVLTAPRWRLAFAAASVGVVIIVALPLIMMSIRNGGEVPVIVSQSGDVAPRSAFGPVAGWTPMAGRPSGSRDAALMAFTNRVALEDNRFVVRPGGDPVPVSGPARELRILLTDLEGNEVSDLSFSIPADAKNLQVWLLSLPDRELTKLSLVGSAMTVQWDDSVFGRSGCITVTYTHQREFVSTDAHLFEIP